ncbi:hypothetical protein [Actinocrispum wychmicini]|uniref:Uncharacterized protein n=1 Tax=Actinocrispum wychmicini TaxID=1213861 RepID=A0A4R2J6P2_9PSEU|nr:hypothetical protein [Actinocrispum wychmicini]TCO54144.1 hypothetical protein EV192_109124 [Actinocrispum wychmicini]
MPTNTNIPNAAATVVSGGQVEITARLYRTANDRIVREGHPDAAFFYGTPGTYISVTEAERYGLLPASNATAGPGKARRKPDSRGV